MPLYHPPALVNFARALLIRAGLSRALARDVAEILVEGDLFGKTTHGLALLPSYLRELNSGQMTLRGIPKILRQSAATLHLDANYLPGPYVVRRALAWAIPRAKKHGVATVSLQHCHHLACLEAYLRAATDRRLAILLICSDPANAVVAPPGGRRGVFSPNPIAAGFPTTGAPILIDTTTSSHSNAELARRFRAKQKFSFAALQSSAGKLTNNPAVMFTQPPGAILPLGGPVLGHKGFALSLIVEALTNALGGHGRAHKPARWGASVFLQIIDPAFFGGRAAFARETQFFAQACRQSKKLPGTRAIRLPGEQSLALHAHQSKHGVALHLEILPALQPWLEKFSVPPPAPIRTR